VAEEKKAIPEQRGTWDPATGRVVITGSAGGKPTFKIGSGAKDARPRVTLAQLLVDPESLPSPEGEGAETEVVVRPVNLGGLKKLEDAYGQDLVRLPRNPREIKQADVLKIATILVNQDRDAKQAMSEEEVGRLIDAEKMNAVGDIIWRMIHPLLASAQMSAQTLVSQAEAIAESATPESPTPQ